MRKFLLLMISIVVVCLSSGLVSLHSQQQGPSQDNEVATPVIEDELTPQQREHSKLYEAYGRKDKIRDVLIKGQGGLVSFSTACSFISLEPLDLKRSKTGRKLKDVQSTRAPCNYEAHVSR